MGMLATQLQDPMLRFNNSILTGNIEERVKTLVETGQLALAYLTARTHNLTEMVEILEYEIQESDTLDSVMILDETEKLI